MELPQGNSRASLASRQDYGRQHNIQIMNNASIIIRPIVLTAGLLLIPALGNMYIDGWNWHWTAFSFFGAVLFGAGLAYELVGKYARAGVMIGFIAGEIVAAGIIGTLRYLYPQEDVAGVVIITFLFSGLIFSSIGFLIHNYRRMK